MNYQEFIKSKAIKKIVAGIPVSESDLNQSLFDYQRYIVAKALKRGKCAIFADTGLGKFHPIDEPILTPYGWDEIGNIKIGDKVIGRNGKPTSVIGVFPQGEKEVVKITFNDGTFSLCGWEHLWNVRTKTMKYRGQDYRTMTTRQIADSIHRDWQIPLCEPVEFDENIQSVLPIDPYTLGVILGDGACGSCQVITTNEEIIDSLNLKGVKTQHKSEGIVEFRFHGLQNVLRDLNLYGKRSWEKHIPEEYLLSSVESRINLIQGLLDTDGFPMEDGGIEFCSTSEMLMKGFCELVRSIGGIARNESSRITKYQGGLGRISYRVNIKMPMGIKPFRFSGKLNRWVEPTKYLPTKIIRSIESMGYEQESVCIKVESPEHLYITRDYIVTHNTLMELEWAHHVSKHEDKPVLILTPLSVSYQMEREAKKFGYSAYVAKDQASAKGLIVITNYEKLHHFDASEFCGIVLDESSILKSHDGKYRQLLTEFAANLQYRLSASATPSPNDYMELGTQSEFLGVLSRTEMLATFFTHDGGDTAKWRLKGHGRKEFWKWMATWAIAIRKPSDLGFSDDGYQLPPLNIHDVTVAVSNDNLSTLFAMQAQTLQERRQAKKDSLEDRIKACVDLVNNSDESWIIWCNLNTESEALKKALRDSFEVKGSDSVEHKEAVIEGFLDGSVRILVTKASIFGFGLNLQNCHNMAFVGLSDSYEQLYQAIRRCWRFGQTQPVNVYMIAAETEGNIKQNLERKEQQMATMFKEMTDSMKEFGDEVQTDLIDTEYNTKTVSGDNWELHLGDCVQEIQKLADESVDYSIFSPPFASLYTYSSSAYDMGNSADYDEFGVRFRFLIKELHRVLRSGRLVSFHCMNLPLSKQNDGVIGLRDFRGDLIRAFVEEGFVYHSEVVIWKDPVIAMQRTKAIGLLHKQVNKDSAMSRQGVPDYLVTMRKRGVNENPVSGLFDHYVGDDAITQSDSPVRDSINIWQRYASPVWMDINPSNTLQYQNARDNDDERHICPLQLDVIHRALQLWTNPNDLVLDPFNGIGSSGVVSLEMKRRYVGFELKRSYYNMAVKNLQLAESKPDQLTLFAA